MSGVLPLLLLLVAVPGAADEAAGQAPLSATAAVAAPAAAPDVPAAYDTDLDGSPAEPDFEVVDLPTNLRLPRHKLALRLTHRFGRALGDGSFSDLLGDFFGFDGGAQVGLGLRYGVRRGTWLGLYRTSDRTILLTLQQELLSQTRAPLGLSLRGSVEGADNFGLTDVAAGSELHQFAPAVSLVASRALGGRGAVYVVPSWVGHTRNVPSAPAGHDNSVVLGLGARWNVSARMALVGEVHPRLAGYRGSLGSSDPAALATFGLEWRVGGHAFQLDFSNALGTTPAQIARGAQPGGGWFIGFNLSRKFY